MAPARRSAWRNMVTAIAGSVSTMSSTSRAFLV